MERDADLSALSADERRDLLLPIFSAALEDDDQMVAHAAALALGRSGDAQALGSLREALDASSAEIRHAALLALGPLGERAALPSLWNVLHDTKQGRSTTRTNRVRDYERESAIVAFGMLSDAMMADRLLAVVEREKNRERNLAAAAVFALGLAPEPTAERIVTLSKLLDDRRLDGNIRAQVPIALARLGDMARPTVPALLATLRDKKTPHDVRHSCAIALGRLGSSSDTEVQKALSRVLRRDSDARLRHLAAISLGRIGVLSVIAGELADVRHASDLPWLVLAAGIAGRDVGVDDPARVSMIEDLESLFAKRNDPSEVGAIATALGLLRARETGDAMRERFLDSNDDTMRSHLALALGLAGDKDAIEPLFDVLDSSRIPHLTGNVALALGLLQAPGLNDRLLAQIGDDASLPMRLAAMRALGRVGDRRAVAALAPRVTTGKSGIERAAAVDALGRLGEGKGMAWSAPFAIDGNPLLPLGIARELAAME